MNDKKTCSAFCIKPFTQYSSFNDHHFRLCCSAKEPSKRIFTKDKSIHEIFNSDYLREVRKNLLDGIKIKECEGCYKLEEQGAQSDRHLANKEYFANHSFDEQELFTGDYAVQGPVSLDLRVGNLCNLRCQSCFPDLSSGVYEDVKSLAASDPNIFVEPHGKRLLEAGFSVSQVEKVLPFLENLKIIGGEPLLSTSARELLDRCVESGYASQISLHFHTNLTVWDTSFFELTRNFKQVLVCCSLDGVGVVNEYLRYPSRWSTVSTNLARLVDFYQNYEGCSVSVSPVIQITNISTLSDLLKYLVHDLQIVEKSVSLAPILLVAPTYLSPYIVPEFLKEIALKKMRDFVELQSETIQKHLAPFLVEFETISLAKPDPLLLDKYIGVTEAYDRKRGQMAEAIFPEYLALKEYVRGHRAELERRNN